MIFNFILHIIIVAVASVAIPNFEIQGIFSVIIFVIILGLVNWIIVPTIKLLAMPINFLTLGIFNLIINILAIMIVSFMVDGIQFTGDDRDMLTASFILALVISFSNYLMTSNDKKSNK